MKNPDKFYDQVLSQDIQQTKVRKNKEQVKAFEEKRANERKSGVSPSKQRKIPLEMTQKITKRKCARVLDVVKVKMGEMMISRLGIDMNPEVQAAMRSTAVQRHIQEGIDNKDIKLVDDNRKTMFVDEMHNIGQKGDRADSSPLRQGQNDIDHDQLEGANLQMTEERAEQIQGLVQDEVRKRQLDDIERMIQTQVDEMWAQYDKDKSGALQKNEARTFVEYMMKDMGCEFEESQFEECFKELD